MERAKTRKNTYNRVFDDRDRRVRGLWIRNGVYYAQMRLADRSTPVKVKIQDAKTVPQAIDGLQELKKQKRAGVIAIARTAGIPSLTESITAYLAERKNLKDKRPATIKREESGLTFWTQFAGDRAISKIGMEDAFAFASWRKKTHRVSGRAVDLNVTALRQVLNHAVRGRLIPNNPIDWKPIADAPKRVRLVPPAEINLLCSTALKVLPITGRLFCDFVRFLQYSGCREAEARRMRWADIDLKRRLITIGSDGLTKNEKARVLPMNEKLEKHLRSMFRRRKKSDLLFPSPRGGGIVTSFKTALKKVMQRSGITSFGFHHLRHYFISHCVMSGVDFKTLAEWVGHQDSGILIGKVYSHLNNEHGRRQARRVKV
jgi:integrase